MIIHFEKIIWKYSNVKYEKSNLNHIIRLGDNRLEIYFDDLSTTIYLDDSYSFIKKQEEYSYKIRSLEEVIYGQVNSLFGYERDNNFKYKAAISGGYMG